QKLALENGDKNVRVWDFPGDKVIFSTKTMGTVRALAWSPDGKRFAVANGKSDKKGIEPGEITVWDLLTRKEVIRLPVPLKEDDKICYLEWTPDGKRLHFRQSLHAGVWDATKWKEVVALGTKIGDFSGYSRDGKLRAWISVFGGLGEEVTVAELMG